VSDIAQHVAVSHKVEFEDLDWDKARAWLEPILAGAGDLVRSAGVTPVGEGTSTLMAPYRPERIFCAASNYVEHANEMGTVLASKAESKPYMFLKLRNTVIGPNETVRMPPETKQLDWEVELAAVIGTRAHNVAVEDALDHVYGYTVANDVSARDLQQADGQWVRAKSLDTFCPLGDELVSVDDPQDLKLITRVNGEVVQDSNTSEMIFGVAELISFCSHSFTLEAGDVILTGTPWGCGEFMDPKRSLKDGDVVECEVEGVGVLRNPVVEV